MKYLPTTRGREKQAKQQFTWPNYFVFFGADVMRQNTAATLDVTKMREIKNIILGIYGLKRCTQDKSALWDKCKKAIGQKCKNLRYNK